MAEVLRLTVDLNGWQGAPGMNTWHFLRSDSLNFDEEHVNSAVSMLQTCYTWWQPHLLNGMTCALRTEAQVFEPAEGTLTDFADIEFPWTVNGAGLDTALSRATMAVSKEMTLKVYDGRRLNGRHFIGPLNGNAITNAGQLNASVIQAVIDGLSGMTQLPLNTRLAVWHRPKKDEDGNLVRVGGAAFVNAVSCMSKPGVLRSRRD